MAASEGQERTQQATPKRREDARKKGQVPRSKELNATLMLVGAASMMLMFGNQFMGALAELFRTGLILTRAQIFDPGAMTHALRSLFQDGFYAALPLLIVTVVIALGAPLLLSGWTFSSEQISMKFSRLNPITGLGRMFSWRGLLELFKALIKFSFILAIAVIVLWSEVDSMLGLGSESLHSAASHAAHLAAWTFLLLSCALVLLPLIDVPFQLWDHTRQLRMSYQEIRDEYKQSEGSPEVKARIRQLQRDMARRRMMKAVPQADVIVTNPTHYAVALRYDQGKSHAPVVVAKGMDLIAMHIRTLGEEHKVPVIEAPPLARALYYSTKLDKEIPMGLYLAVAKLL
ncbi:MAG: flagellar biosynthesis protein FlhB, partial [Gammaproteobacteria bacterium]|nr:flagellar biosynthesis protein FlhB [Gammaproteobacteria bacterium]